MKTGFHEIDVDIVHWTGMFDALVDFRSQEGQRGTLPPGRETGEEYSTKRKYIFTEKSSPNIFGRDPRTVLGRRG